jgi:hypothetical protein
MLFNGRGSTPSSGWSSMIRHPGNVVSRSCRSAPVGKGPRRARAQTSNVSARAGDANATGCQGGRRTTAGSSRSEAGWPQPKGHGRSPPERTSDLATKNRKLVSQHHDLELLEFTRTQTQRRHGERPPKQQVHERHHQEQTPSTRTQTRPTYDRQSRSETLSCQRMDLRTPQGG